jgi:hypothetical protein
MIAIVSSLQEARDFLWTLGLLNGEFIYLQLTEHERANYMQLGSQNGLTFLSPIECSYILSDEICDMLDLVPECLLNALSTRSTL